MAYEQTFTLSPRNTIAGVYWSSGVLASPVALDAFFSPEGESRWVSEITITGAGDNSIALRLTDAATTTGDIGGDDLVTDWEDSDEAMTLAVGTTEVTIAGPGAALSDRYVWRPDGISTLIGAVTANADLTVTFRVPLSGTQIIASLQPGAFAFQAALSTEKHIRVRSTMSPGSPAASFGLVTEKEVGISAGLAPGALEFACRVSTGGISASLRPGVLTAALDLVIQAGVRPRASARPGPLSLTAAPTVLPRIDIESSMRPEPLTLAARLHVAEPVRPRSAMSAGMMRAALDVGVLLPVVPSASMSSGRLTATFGVDTTAPRIRVRSRLAALPLRFSAHVRAFHQETVLKDALRLHLQLDGETWSDVSEACSDVTFDQIAWSRSRKYAPDAMNARIHPSRAPEAVRILLSANWLIPARLIDPDVGTAWLGYILPGRTAIAEDEPDAVRIEGVDYLEDLRVGCPDMYHRNQTLLDILTDLFMSVQGYGLANIGLPGELARHRVAYVVRVADDQQVLSLADQLLHEHGYVLHAGVTDRGLRLIQVRRWWHTELPDMSETPQLRRQVRVRHDEIEHQSVEIEWPQIAEQRNALLYRMGLPLPDEDSRGGRIILAGTSIPVDDEAAAPWLRYRKRWVEGNEADDFDLLSAEDQRVEWRGDSDISLTVEVHQRLRSQIQFTNEGGDNTQRLLYADIRGTAVYREVLRRAAVSTTPAVEVTVRSGTRTVVRVAGNVSPVDGAYVDWSLFAGGSLREISAWNGRTRTATLRTALGVAPAAGDAVKLVPPAAGEPDRIRAKFLTDRDDAVALMVAWRDTIAHGSWSFRALIVADDVPSLGSFVRVQYSALGVDRICQVVRSVETLGTEYPLAEVDLYGAAAVDVDVALARISAGGFAIGNADGEAGEGREEIFAITDDSVTVLADSQLPDNAWPFKRPGTSDDVLWSIRERSAALGEVGWSTARSIMGAPAAGAQPLASWGAWEMPEITQRPGPAGRDGDAGITPDRPPGVFFVERTSSSWSDAEATSATSFDGGPIVGDRVTQYRSPTWVDTRRWTGTAWVDVTEVIDGNLLVEGSIQSDALAAAVVLAGKIAANAITADKIIAGAISNAKIASAGLSGSAIADAAIVADKIAAGAVIAAKIATGAVEAAKIAANAVTAGKIAANAITADKIIAGAISNAKIASAGLSGSAIADAAIVADKIAAGAVIAAKIATGAVEAAKIAANAVTAGKIAANAITADKIIAGAISNAKIASAGLSGSAIADAAIVADKIAAGAVIAAKIATGAVEAAKIAANAVTAGKIAANAITADKIIAGAISNAKIASAGLSGSAIADAAIVADKIAAGAVIAAKIATGAVEAAKIAANAVTAGKIAANAITADKIIAGAVIADKIAAGTLNTLIANIGTDSGRARIVQDTIVIQTLESGSWTTKAALRYDSTHGGAVRVDRAGGDVYFEAGGILVDQVGVADLVRTDAGWRSGGYLSAAQYVAAGTYLAAADGYRPSATGIEAQDGQVTHSEVYNWLSPALPNTGDRVLLSGGFQGGTAFFSLAYAVRASSSSITVYYHSDDAAVQSGGGTVSAGSSSNFTSNGLTGAW